MRVNPSLEILGRRARIGSQYVDGGNTSDEDFVASSGDEAFDDAPDTDEESDHSHSEDEGDESDASIDMKHGSDQRDVIDMYNFVDENFSIVFIRRALTRLGVRLESGILKKDLIKRLIKHIGVGVYDLAR
jgi:hypothetical protein